MQDAMKLTDFELADFKDLRDEVGQHDFAADVEELAEAFERVPAAVEVVKQAEIFLC